MVNVIDNTARERVNKMPVGIKIIDDKGDVAHTAKTDLGTNYISLESKWFGSSSNNTGGNTDPDSPDHPTFGDNYYAGSLSDGEITERNLEWSGIDDPTKDTIVTFNDDPGLKPFGQYTGLTILGHIQKTAMTAGTKGAVSTLDLNYDPNNTPKDGYFTTTASYPNYVKSEGLVVGNSLSIPINGVGENLKGNNIKSPEIQLTYNADKTLTIKHIQGYDNDGNASGATGANYDVIVDVIATFSTQKAVAQLPSSIVYFSGSINHGQDIVLAGPSDFYENSMDGIEITLEDYIHFGTERRLAIGALGGLKTTYRIPKEQLILGNKWPIPMDSMIDIVEEPKSGLSTGNNNLPIASLQGSTPHWLTGDTDHLFYRGYLDPTISINKNSIKFNLAILMEGKASGTGSPLKWGNPTRYTWNILKVTPYKN